MAVACFSIHPSLRLIYMGKISAAVLVIAILGNVTEIGV